MTNKTNVSIPDYEAWVQSREQYAIGTNCGWCGRGLPGGAPPLIDRIAALEAERERREGAERILLNIHQCGWIVAPDLDAHFARYKD